MASTGSDETKARISDLYNRVVTLYGQIGPNTFAHLAEVMQPDGIHESGQMQYILVRAQKN